MQYYFFSENLFHLLAVLPGSIYVSTKWPFCWCLPFKLRNQLMVRSFLFVYPESRGGNEDKRSKIPAWLEDLWRKKKQQLFVYIKEGNHHGTTSFRTQQGKFLIFSCVLQCSWYTCTCFSCTDEIWIIWKEWSQWCGRIPRPLKSSESKWKKAANKFKPFSMGERHWNKTQEANKFVKKTKEGNEITVRLVHIHFPTCYMLPVTQWSE